LVTSEAWKPNPPSPPSLQGNGSFKASLRSGERNGSGVSGILYDFSNILLAFFISHRSQRVNK
jgi:hypothetical protein